MHHANPAAAADRTAIVMMPLLLSVLTVVACPPDSAVESSAAPPSATASVPTASGAAPRTVSSVERVGGDLEAKSVDVDGEWRHGSMRIEAPLPEGYPAPTPPGAIDLKVYPAVRRAEYVGRGDSQAGMFVGFWPLFQHIKRREIAMTSPVEMDYRGWSGDAAAKPERWTMSFLYRTSGLGHVGDDGAVRVVDTEPVTVVAIGLRGVYRLEAIAEGVTALEAWLASHPEWKATGDPRAFYYNGPEIRNADKWAEAQVPVTRVEVTSGTGNAR